MSVQKQRHTKARRDRARVQFTMKSKKLVKCSHCDASVEAHMVCPKCGHYKGKEVVDTTKKLKAHPPRRTKRKK